MIILQDLSAHRMVTLSTCWYLISVVSLRNHLRALLRSAHARQGFDPSIATPMGRCCVQNRANTDNMIMISHQAVDVCTTASHSRYVTCKWGRLVM